MTTKVFIRSALAVVLCTASASAQEPPGPPPEGGSSAPAKAATAKLKGKVTDALNGSGLSGVRVDVVGANYSATTAEDGSFELALPPGKYTLRFWTPGYIPMRARGIVLWQGAQRRVDISLDSDDTSLEDFVVEAAPDTSSVDALALERRRSSVVGDSGGPSRDLEDPGSGCSPGCQAGRGRHHRGQPLRLRARTRRTLYQRAVERRSAAQPGAGPSCRAPRPVSDADPGKPHHRQKPSRPTCPATSPVAPCGCRPGVCPTS